MNKEKECKYHFIDCGTLWAWPTLPATFAQEVYACPHCGFRIEKKQEPEYNGREEERLEETGEV